MSPMKPVSPFVLPTLRLSFIYSRPSTPCGARQYFGTACGQSLLGDAVGLVSSDEVTSLTSPDGAAINI